ncbi:hypothetical protein [Chitinimonas lacunae]|uniref:Uncharacterized protein n=1 Tax=Chitinimonas lacunae TaxID=1963018 RepID=A0ABV8MXW6_9NEIS
MENHFSRRYALVLSGSEIKAFGNLVQLARAQLAANPPQALRGCPFVRQAGLIGPQLYDVERLICQVVEDLGLPDLPPTITPAKLLLETLMAEAVPGESLPTHPPLSAGEPGQNPPSVDLNSELHKAIMLVLTSVPGWLSPEAHEAIRAALREVKS